MYKVKKITGFLIVLLNMFKIIVRMDLGEYVCKKQTNKQKKC